MQNNNHSSHPVISVLMPVYNVQNYIVAAIDSVLNQTFTNFELIIIDDASTDDSIEIIKTFKDARITIITKSRNTGYTESLNLGLSLASGKYIARMDGDDICALNRFERQVEFMESNTDVAVCGTWYKTSDTNKIIRHPKSHEEIKIGLLSGCIIAHPTVFIRSSFLRENQLSYNPAMEPAEDYDLWSRVCLIGKLANMEEVLLTYRVHEHQVSIIKQKSQSNLANKIVLSLLRSLIPELQEEDVENYPPDSEENVLKFYYKRLAILSSLQHQNEAKQVFEHNRFKQYILDRKKTATHIFLNSPKSIKRKYFFSIISNFWNISDLVGFYPTLRYIIKIVIGYRPRILH